MSRHRNNWGHVLGIAAIVLELAFLLGCTSNAPLPAGGSPLPKTNTMAYTGAAVTAAGVGISLIPAVGPAIGVPVAAGGGTLLVLAFVLAKYGGLLALGGLVVMLGGLVVVAWVKLRQYRTGFTEVVAGTQEVKEQLAEAGKLSRKAINKVLASTQAASTTKLVASVKEKLGI